MQALVVFMCVSGIAFIVALTLLLIWKVVRGHIRIAGLLRDANGEISQTRVQLLFMTIGTAATYLARSTVTHQVDALPTPPESLLTAIGGSNTLYLLVKRFGTPRS